MWPFRQLSKESAGTRESHTSAESHTRAESGAITEPVTIAASRTLDSLSANARTIDGVWADDVELGDRLVVYTQNSVYTLTALGGNFFQVAGGWFAENSLESDKVHVVGCTWGGRAILTRMIAAPGMCIEFDNTVQTTSVRDVRLFRCVASAVRH